MTIAACVVNFTFLNSVLPITRVDFSVGVLLTGENIRNMNMLVINHGLWLRATLLLDSHSAFPVSWLLAGCRGKANISCNRLGCTIHRGLATATNDLVNDLVSMVWSHDFNTFSFAANIAFFLCVT